MIASYAIENDDVLFATLEGIDGVDLKGFLKVAALI